LANVKRLYETAPAQGQEMLASLINYLRAALPSMRQSGSTLSRELELARSFLTILKMRMRERLSFSIDHDPALENARVPPMVLPTLVENAIKHGLSPLPQGGNIEIRARRAGEDLIVEVHDTGLAFQVVPAQALDSPIRALDWRRCMAVVPVCSWHRYPRAA